MFLSDIHHLKSKNKSNFYIYSSLKFTTYFLFIIDIQAALSFMLCSWIEID